MDFYPNKGFQSTQTMQASMSTELPKKDDIMYVMVKGDVYSVVGANTLVPSGCDVIVLKVTSLKKAKTVLE